MRWNQKASYAYTRTHQARDWGWEFIRRDAQYQKEWETESTKFERGAHKQVLLPYLLVPDVSQYSSEPFVNVNLTDPNNIKTFIIPSDGAMKWGLKYYQNPRAQKLTPANFHLVKLLHVGGSESQDETLDVLSVASEDHTLVAVIDLKKPIKSQVDEISKRSLKLQGELRKRKPELVTLRAEKVSSEDKKRWTIYLQCLDAKKAGVKRKDAALTIFPSAEQTPAQKWSETMKQIHKIAKNNYRQFMD